MDNSHFLMNGILLSKSEMPQDASRTMANRRSDLSETGSPFPIYPATYFIIIGWMIYTPMPDTANGTSHLPEGAEFCGQELRHAMNAQKDSIATRTVRLYVETCNMPLRSASICNAAADKYASAHAKQEELEPSFKFERK